MRLSIEIVPYTRDREEAVRAFNGRMRGSGWGWYEDSYPDWIPKRPGQKTWREYWLAVENGDTVRGGYGLRPQEWLIQGKTALVTDWQGPVSEGVLSRAYNTLGLRLLRDMLKKYPLLYSWGHGGYEEPLVQMLRSLKWLLHDTPFLVRVLNASRFLRKNRYLRTNELRKVGSDLAAFTGLGEVGFRALHRVLQVSAAPRVELFRRSPSYEVAAHFGPWADEVWARSKDRYTALSVRDAATMNAIVPDKGWPPGIRLKVMRGGQVIGWAVVLDTSMSDDTRFGDCRVGSIIDALATPEDAAHVVGAAFEFLRDRGVDLVVANHANPAWISAFRAHGFLAVENKRIFAASPELEKALTPWEVTRSGIYLTNMDGHGPHAL